MPTSLFSSFHGARYWFCCRDFYHGCVPPGGTLWPALPQIPHPIRWGGSAYCFFSVFSRRQRWSRCLDSTVSVPSVVEHFHKFLITPSSSFFTNSPLSIILSCLIPAPRSILLPVPRLATPPVNGGTNTRGDHQHKSIRIHVPLFIGQWHRTGMVAPARYPSLTLYLMTPPSPPFLPQCLHEARFRTISPSTLALDYSFYPNSSASLSALFSLASTNSQHLSIATDHPPLIFYRHQCRTQLIVRSCLYVLQDPPHSYWNCP